MGVFNKNCMISYSQYRNIFLIWALGGVSVSRPARNSFLFGNNLRVGLAYPDLGWSSRSGNGGGLMETVMIRLEF
jgi:hypothetical protein